MCGSLCKSLGIPPENTSGRAYQAACRSFPVFYFFQTKVALDGNLFFAVKLHCPKGTGLHTFPAADAYFLVDKHNTLFVPLNCLNRAYLFTGGICAVTTVEREKRRTFFNNPDESRSYTKVVLLFAGNLTSMATAAVFFENSEIFLSHDSPPVDPRSGICCRAELLSW